MVEWESFKGGRSGWREVEGWVVGIGGSGGEVGENGGESIIN